MRPKSALWLSAAVAAACLLLLLLMSPDRRLEAWSRRSDCTLCGPAISNVSNVAAKQAQAALATPPAKPERLKVAPANETSGDVLVGFDVWSQKYVQATAGERAEMIQEGQRLAHARRPIFKQLIQSDPRRALQEAVRPLVRQKLPAEIVAELEKPVEDHSVMRVYQAGPESVANGEPSQLRYVETQHGETYQAYVFGRRAASVAWVMNLSAIGVEMDGQLALDERPLRVMEPGEILPADMPRVAVCPVSKKLCRCLRPSSRSNQRHRPSSRMVRWCTFAMAATRRCMSKSSSKENPARAAHRVSRASCQPRPRHQSVWLKVLYIPVVYPDQTRHLSPKLVLRVCWHSRRAFIRRCPLDA